MENESCNMDEYILKDQLYSIVLAGSFNDASQKIQALQWPIKVSQIKKNRDRSIETFEVASDIKMLVTNGRIEFRTKLQTNIPMISSIIKMLVENILDINNGIKCIGYNGVLDYHFQNIENDNSFKDRFFPKNKLKIPAISVSFMDASGSTINPLSPKRQYTILMTNIVYALSTTQTLPIYRLISNYHFDIQTPAEFEYILSCSEEMLRLLQVEFKKMLKNE